MRARRPPPPAAGAFTPIGYCATAWAEYSSGRVASCIPCDASAATCPRRNPEGSARGTRGGIRVSEQTRKSLRVKVDAHNEEHGDKKGKKVDLGMLLAVFRRGAGAFSTSHSPRVRSRDQWAMARVNAFLHIVRTGRPRNAKYTGDNDLLPKGHPRSTRD